MKIIQAADYEDLSLKAAQLLAAEILLRPEAILGLATGSTPIGLYEQLVLMHQKGLLDFSQIKTVNLDEYRGLDPEDDQSYAWFMNHHLFQHVNLNRANTHLPDGSNPDAEAECTRYDHLIKSLGGIHVQLLGLGNNGHIGFNEPDEVFPKGTHCVELEASTIEANARFFANPEDVPRQAYTMGIQTIMMAKRILMVVSGKGKADILDQVCYGPITPKVPASILQLHRHVCIVADEEALSTIHQHQRLNKS